MQSNKELMTSNSADPVSGSGWQLMRHYGKWFLIPLVIVALFLAALMLVSGTGAAPFVYNIF